jgi:hypothetical protein
VRYDRDDFACRRVRCRSGGHRGLLDPDEETMTEANVAAFLNLDPRNSLYWPVPLLRRLLTLDQRFGRERFLRTVAQMLGTA